MSEPKPELSRLSGVGLGLRAQHYQDILKSLPDIPWFEVLIDNYLYTDGYPLHYLEQVARHYPLSFHGVGMSLGGTEPLDNAYLDRLKRLITRFQPLHVSDHLCWTHHGGLHSHDLLPVPYTRDAARHVAERILSVQDYLGRRILLENVSSYMSYKESEMTEAEFYCEVVELADCDMLCDINNIYVSAYNHDFDAVSYLKSLPQARVREFHLAGFEDQGDYLLDTHGQAVHEPVWQLYQQAIAHFGPIPTLIEWDNNIPEFSRLLLERDKAMCFWPELENA